jgi:hypothetical protein
VGSAYKETLLSKLRLDDVRAAEEKAAVAAHAFFEGLYAIFKSLKTVCVPPPSLAVPPDAAHEETKKTAGFFNT